MLIILKLHNFFSFQPIKDLFAIQSFLTVENVHNILIIYLYIISTLRFWSPSLSRADSSLDPLLDWPDFRSRIPLKPVSSPAATRFLNNESNKNNDLYIRNLIFETNLEFPKHKFNR